MATTFNTALHVSATMVRWLDYRLFEVCDYDGHGILDMSDVSDLADAINVPEDFEDFEVDDLRALADIADGLCDCYRVDDFDDTDGTVYVTSLERVQELESERVYKDDVTAAYREATGF